MIRLLLSVALLFISSFASAEEVTLTGRFTQGGLVIGQTESGSTVIFDGKEVGVTPSGRFVFGFGRDFKTAADLIVRHKDGSEEKRDIRISKRDYKIEQVDGLPPSKVTPSPEFLARIKKENAEIARIRAINTPEEWFLSGWQWPAQGRVSGVYGSQRVLNGIPKQPHFGLDIAAPVGTPVVAPTDGVVRMAAKDLFYTGGTIMIDHGYGLVSVYSHLSKIDVTVGQFVKQGNKIGEIGMTGRATGAHLDWRLNWFNERLDPELLLKDIPKN